MHKRFSLRLLSWFFLMPLLATAAERPVPSRITSAKVFRQGVQVTRTANSSIPAGASTLVFTGLAQQLDPRSIQVSALGNFTVLSVTHRINYLSESPKKKELDELQARMKKLDKEIGLETAMQEVWANEQKLLLSNGNVGGQNGVTVSQLSAVNDYIRTRLQVVKTHLLEQQEKLADLQVEKGKLQKQINDLHGASARPTGEVVVELSSRSATDGVFTLEYYSPQAGWAPLYDLRSAGTDQPMQLMMKAQVTNNTGEDWDKVALVFNSGNPSLGGVMPVLSPWVLRLVQRLIPGGGARQKQRSTLSESTDDRFDSGMYKAEAESGPAVQVSERTTSVEYAIAQPFTVPGDGSAHTVVVQEHRIQATYKHFATPKLDKDVFLYASITDWEDLNLVSGEANIFFEGTFVGKSFLDLEIQADTMEVGLGRDKGVVVERVKRKGEDQKALIGGSRTVAIGWDITVRNTKGIPVHLELRDQYPLSGQSEFEVKLTDKGGATVDDGKGLLTWQLELAPKTSQKIGFAYTVKHPKGQRPMLE